MSYGQQFSGSRFSAQSSSGYGASDYPPRNNSRGEGGDMHASLAPNPSQNSQYGRGGSSSTGQLISPVPFSPPQPSSRSGDSPYSAHTVPQRHGRPSLLTGPYDAEVPLPATASASQRPSEGSYGGGGAVERDYPRGGTDEGTHRYGGGSSNLYEEPPRRYASVPAPREQDRSSIYAPARLQDRLDDRLPPSRSSSRRDEEHDLDDRDRDRERPYAAYAHVPSSVPSPESLPTPSADRRGESRSGYSASGDRADLHGPYNDVPGRGGEYLGGSAGRDRGHADSGKHLYDGDARRGRDAIAIERELVREQLLLEKEKELRARELRERELRERELRERDLLRRERALKEGGRRDERSPEREVEKGRRSRSRGERGRERGRDRGRAGDRHDDRGRSERSSTGRERERARLKLAVSVDRHGEWKREYQTTRRGGKDGREREARRRGSRSRERSRGRSASRERGRRGDKERGERRSHSRVARHREKRKRGDERESAPRSWNALTRMASPLVLNDPTKRLHLLGKAQLQANKAYELSSEADHVKVREAYKQFCSDLGEQARMKTEDVPGDGKRGKTSSGGFRATCPFMWRECKLQWLASATGPTPYGAEFKAMLVFFLTLDSLGVPVDPTLLYLCDPVSTSTTPVVSVTTSGLGKKRRSGGGGGASGNGAIDKARAPRVVKQPKPVVVTKAGGKSGGGGKPHFSQKPRARALIPMMPLGMPGMPGMPMAMRAMGARMPGMMPMMPGAMFRPMMGPNGLMRMTPMGPQPVGGGGWVTHPMGGGGARGRGRRGR